jgi:hypothetical protein
VATLTRTYTKTYALLDAWAQSFPWDCRARSTSCASKTHDHSPMVGDVCAVESCDEPIRERESCYMVVQVEGWVCWRHVHPDDGPKLYPIGDAA